MIAESLLPETKNRDVHGHSVAFEDMDNTWERWADRRVRFFDAQKDAAEAALLQIGIDKPVDEIAIMAFDEHQEYHLIEGAVRNGWEVFNAAEDVVDTYPIRSNYKVHYTFLRHPDTGYRLEVMRLLEGVSPLHSCLATQVLMSDHDTPILVHASFKVSSLGALGTVEDFLAESGSFMLAQGCRSTYGAFAYYAVTEQNDLLGAATNLTTYLKPRVNLRDQA